MCSSEVSHEEETKKSKRAMAYVPDPCRPITPTPTHQPCPSGLVVDHLTQGETALPQVPKRGTERQSPSLTLAGWPGPAGCAGLGGTLADARVTPLPEPERQPPCRAPYAPVVQTLGSQRPRRDHLVTAPRASTLARQFAGYVQARDILSARVSPFEVAQKVHEPDGGRPVQHTGRL